MPRDRRNWTLLRQTGVFEHLAWRDGSQPWLTELLGPYDPAKPYAEIAEAMEMGRLDRLAQFEHQEGWGSVSPTGAVAIKSKKGQSNETR